jgi:hypothetical protein
MAQFGGPRASERLSGLSLGRQYQSTEKTVGLPVEMAAFEKIILSSERAFNSSFGQVIVKYGVVTASLERRLSAPGRSMHRAGEASAFENRCIGRDRPQ